MDRHGWGERRVVRRRRDASRGPRRRGRSRVRRSLGSARRRHVNLKVEEKRGQASKLCLIIGTGPLSLTLTTSAGDGSRVRTRPRDRLGVARPRRFVLSLVVVVDRRNRPLDLVALVVVVLFVEEWWHVVLPVRVLRQLDHHPVVPPDDAVGAMPDVHASVLPRPETDPVRRRQEQEERRRRHRVGL